MGIICSPARDSINLTSYRTSKSNQTFDIYCHCPYNVDFLANSYFIVQIYHAKSFKMKYIKSMYLNFLLR